MRIKPKRVDDAWTEGWETVKRGGLSISEAQRVSLDRTFKHRRLSGPWKPWDGEHVEREGLLSIHNLANPLYTFSLSWPGSSTIRRSISVDLTWGRNSGLPLQRKCSWKRRVQPPQTLRLQTQTSLAFTDCQWGQWLKIVSAIFSLLCSFNTIFFFLSPPL